MSRDRQRVQRISTPGPWENAGGYVRAVRVGERVLLAGTTASRADEAVPVDAGDQARIAFATIATALGHAGARLADVVRTRMYVVDLRANAHAVLAVHNELLRDVRPVAAILGVTALIEPELLVEIEVEAIVGVGDVFEG